MQAGRQRKTTEENIDNRIGKTAHRLFDVHIREAKQYGQQRYHQCGDCDVYRFGKPHNGDKDQYRNAFIGIGFIRENIVNTEADYCGNDGGNQTLEVGERWLRSQQLDIVGAVVVIGSHDFCFLCGCG